MIRWDDHRIKDLTSHHKFVCDQLSTGKKHVYEQAPRLVVQQYNNMDSDKLV